MKEMSSKSKNLEDEPKRHIVLPGKRKILEVKDKSDQAEHYDQFDGIPPFAIEVDPSTMLAKEETPYSRHDNDQGTFIKKKFFNTTL